MPLPYRLRTVLDFTAEDLAANQRGELTEHQRERLRSKRGWSLVLAGALLIPHLSV